jgi:hypothetical protein
MFPTMWSSLDKNKTPTKEDFKKIQSFMFCKWLAGDYRTIFDANIFNQYSDIPIENQYYYIKNKHAGKIRNIKYIKAEKDEFDEGTVRILEQHYKISTEKALDYLNYISPEELKYLKELYAPRK